MADLTGGWIVLCEGAAVSMRMLLPFLRASQKQLLKSIIFIKPIDIL